jgi:uncharacterized protein
MKWRGRRGSTNVEDRRGMGGKGLAVGGGVGGLIIVLIITLLGGNPGDILGGINGGTEKSAPYEETEK